MTDIDKIHPPWSAEQVEALNEYQQAGWFHPFTCGHCRDNLGAVASRYARSTGTNDDRSLIATKDGWVCETCDYKQDWAWAMMAQGPPEGFSPFVTRVGK